MVRSGANSLIHNIASNSTSSTVPLKQVFEDDQLQQKIAKLGPQQESQGCECAGAVEYVSPEASYERYTRFLEVLNYKERELRGIYGLTTDIGEQLNDLTSVLKNISVKCLEFQSSTSSMYDRYHDMYVLHQEIGEQLAKFENLDHVTRKLNRYQNVNVVKKDSFKGLLEKIQASLEFLQEHESYRDAESYRIRFKQKLHQACAMIVNYLTNYLKTIELNTQSKFALVSRTSSSVTARDALLYNKFSASALEYRTQLNMLLECIESEANSSYSDELQNFLRTCFDQYFSTRDRFLTSEINPRFYGGDAENNASLAEFIQDGLLYFTQLSEKEYGLFIEFFPERYAKSVLHGWLFQLCEPLHESVRARVLRETSVNMLCDSITILNKYFQFEQDSSEYQLQFKKINFDKLFEPILQEVQSRLVFRCQTFIDQKVLNVKLTKELLGTFLKSDRTEAYNFNSSDDELVSHYLMLLGFPKEPSNDNPILSYYPPLIYSLAVLSKIYQLVNSSVFDDLAHHVAHDCVESLKKAFTLACESSASQAIEAHLSYVKNLLFLRDQINNFDIQYIRNETYLDFSGLTDLVTTIRARSFSQRSTTSVFSLARDSVPRVVNNMVDAKSELVVELRNAMSSFTELAANEIVQSAFSTTDPALVPENIQTLSENLRPRLQHMSSSIAAQIKDPAAASKMLNAVRDLIAHTYSAFFAHIDQDATRTSLTPPDQFANLLDTTIEHLAKS